MAAVNYQHLNYQHIAFPGISKLPVVDKTQTHSLFPCARAKPVSAVSDRVAIEKSVVPMSFDIR